MNFLCLLATVVIFPAMLVNYRQFISFANGQFPFLVELPSDTVFVKLSYFVQARDMQQWKSILRFR